MFHPIAARPIAAKLNNPEITSAETILLKNGKGKEFIEKIQQKARSQLPQSTPQKIIENNKRDWKGLYKIYELCASETIANQVFNYLEKPNNENPNPINWQTVLKPAGLGTKLPSLWALIAVDRFNKANVGDGDGFYSACVVYNCGVRCTVVHPSYHRCLYCGAWGEESHQLIATTLTPEWSKRESLCTQWSTIRQDFLDFADYFVDREDLAALRKFEEVVFPHADLAVAYQGNKWQVDDQKKTREAAKGQRKEKDLKYYIAKADFEKKYLELLKDECKNFPNDQPSSPSVVQLLQNAMASPTKNNSEQTNNNNNSEQTTNNNSESPHSLDDELKSLDVGNREAVLDLLKRSGIIESFVAERNDENNNFDKDPCHQDYRKFCWSVPQLGKPFTIWCGCPSCALSTARQTSIHNVYPAHFFSNLFLTDWKNRISSVRAVVKLFAKGDDKNLHDTTNNNSAAASNLSPRSPDAQDETGPNASTTTPEDMFYQYRIMKRYSSERLTSFDFTLENSGVSVLVTRRHDNDLVPVLKEIYETTDSNAAWRSRLALTRKFLLACLEIHGSTQPVIVHGDIKPQNIVVDYDDLGVSSVLFIDFEFSANVSEKQGKGMTSGMTSTVFKTDFWCSILKQQHPRIRNTQRDDCYSIALILYEIAHATDDEARFFNGKTKLVLPQFMFDFIRESINPEDFNDDEFIKDWQNPAKKREIVFNDYQDKTKVMCVSNRGKPVVVGGADKGAPKIPDSANRLYAVTMKSLFEYYCQPRSFTRDLPYPYRRLLLLLQPSEFCSAITRLVFQLQAYKHDKEKKKNHCFWIPQLFNLLKNVKKEDFFLNLDTELIEACHEYTKVMNIKTSKVERDNKNNNKNKKNDKNKNNDDYDDDDDDDDYDDDDDKRVDFTKSMNVLEALRHLRNIFAHPVLSPDHMVASIISNCSGIFAVLQTALIAVEEQSDKRWLLNISNGAINYTTT